MSGVSNAAGSCIAQRRHAVDQLQEKPQPDENPGRHARDPEEESKRYQSPDVARRVEHEVPGEDSGDGPARAKSWGVRIHRGGDLQGVRAQAADQVESQVAQATHRTFDMEAENEQEEHVAE